LKKESKVGWAYQSGCVFICVNVTIKKTTRGGGEGTPTEGISTVVEVEIKRCLRTV